LAQFQTVEECEFICVENEWPPYPIDGGGENGTETEPETEVSWSVFGRSDIVGVMSPTPLHSRKIFDKM
jgi:hypothetical protein